MNKEVVAAIRKHFPGATVENVERYRKGIMNATFKVTLSSPANVVVYRSYSRDEWKAAKEQYLYKLIRDKTSVPVPEVLAKGKTYSILSHVAGDELDLTDETMVREAGKMLAKVHSIRMPSFGWIVGNAIEPAFADWESFLRFDTEHKLSKLPASEEHTAIGKKVLEILEKQRKLEQRT